MENIKDISETIISPLAFKKGMFITSEETGSISVGKYIKMYNKGVFNAEDMCILRYIYSAGYITRHSLSRVIETGDTCKKSLKKLRKHGLVSKNTLEFSASKERGKIIDYYKLTSVGFQICKVLGNGGKLNITKALLNAFQKPVSDLDTPEDILTQLAFNNFRCGIESDYKDLIKKTVTHYTISYDKSFYTINALYELNLKSSGKNFLLIPVCVRRAVGWKRALYSILTAAYQHIRSNFCYLVPVFIIIVEDAAMAADAFSNMSYHPFKNETVLFATDWYVNRRNILDSLIFMRKYEPVEYDIVSLKYKC